ncbi:ATP-grasp domain-containing protein [Nitrosospira briensis]|uniref:ATP-grasp domain-containing protein n=1 Tax=Nitrosospira briensis TaxID=35799 RepID=UPI0009452EB4|nr:ATP-grasp domain-containing protein [Nitrosospira briensis]
MMILGAGNTATPLIEQAKRRGLVTIVVSPAGDYKGLNLADHQIHCDFRDTEAILKHAKHYAIDGIACTGTDVVVPTIGRVVDELGLYGTGYESAVACSDKWLMKQALIRCGVMTARGVVCDLPDALALAVKTVGFPLMSKAVDSSGSQGVFRVDRPEELRDAWYASRQASTSGRVVLEEYLEGLEYGAQAIVEGNRVKAVFLHNDQLTPPPNHAPVGHSIPCTLGPDQQARSCLEIAAAIEALGICDTVSNVDLMLVGDTPYILEIAARMGATCLPETISIHGGFNAYDVVLSLALGEPVLMTDICKGMPNASRMIESPQDGVVLQIRVPESVRTHPDLHRLSIYAKPGDSVRQFRVGPDRIGDVIVTGSSVAEAEQLAADLASLVEVVFA